MKLGDPKVVGELLRERRHKMGYSIEQFAQLTGISPITIMRIELGRVGYVRAKTAKALEVPKKVENRMVMVPTAIMQSGEAVPLPPLTAMLHQSQSPTSAGDKMTIGQELPKYYAGQSNKRRVALATKKNAEGLHGRAHAASPLRKMLLWIAQKV